MDLLPDLLLFCGAFIQSLLIWGWWGVTSPVLVAAVCTIEVLPIASARTRVAYCLVGCLTTAWVNTQLLEAA